MRLRACFHNLSEVCPVPENVREQKFTKYSKSGIGQWRYSCLVRFLFPPSKHRVVFMSSLIFGNEYSLLGHYSLTTKATSCKTMTKIAAAKYRWLTFSCHGRSSKSIVWPFFFALKNLLCGMIKITRFLQFQQKFRRFLTGRQTTKWQISTKLLRKREKNVNNSVTSKK
mgnify:CR=1 FL=1